MSLVPEPVEGCRKVKGKMGTKKKWGERNFELRGHLLLGWVFLAVRFGLRGRRNRWTWNGSRDVAATMTDHEKILELIRLKDRAPFVLDDRTTACS